MKIKYDGTVLLDENEIEVEDILRTINRMISTETDMLEWFVSNETIDEMRQYNGMDYTEYDSHTNDFCTELTNYMCYYYEKPTIPVTTTLNNIMTLRSGGGEEEAEGEEGGEGESSASAMYYFNSGIITGFITDMRFTSDPSNLSGIWSIETPKLKIYRETEGGSVTSRVATGYNEETEESSSYSYSTDVTYIMNTVLNECLPFTYIRSKKNNTDSTDTFTSLAPTISVTYMTYE